MEVYNFREVENAYLNINILTFEINTVLLLESYSCCCCCCCYWQR